MRPRLALLLVLAVTALVYGVRLRQASYVYEDSNAVWANVTVTGGMAIPIDRARWLSALSHRVVFVLFGKGPRAPHAVNIALHLLNGALVYALAAELIAPWTAVFVAGLFLLHPLQTEAVAYVASRSELLSTNFALLACVLTFSARRWWQHLAIWACVALALCAKESTVVVIPLLVLLDLWRGQVVSRVRLAAVAIPAILAALTVFVHDYRSTSELGLFAYAATQATALWNYLAIVVLPIGQTIDHDFDLVSWPLRWAALLGVGVLALLPILAGLSLVNGDTRQVGRLWDTVPRLKVAAFGLAWMLIAMAPRFVMRIPEVLNEHQTYLPFIGIYLALGAVVIGAERERHPVLGLSFDRIMA